MSFEHNGMATVKTVKLSRGNSKGAQKKAFVGFGITGVSCAMVASILGTRDEREVETSFFRGKDADVDRKGRFPGLTKIETTNFYDKLHRLTILGEKFPAMQITRVGDFEIRVKERCTFDVAFRVTIDFLPAGLLDYLADQLHSAINIDLSQSEDLAGKAAAQSPAAKEPAQPSNRGSAGKNTALN